MQDDENQQNNPPTLDTPRISTDLSKTPSTLPQTLYLLPLTERPFFSPQTLPILMSESSWLPTVKNINESPQRYGGLILTRADAPDKAEVRDFYDTGTVFRMHHPVRSNKKIQFIAEGIQRFKITKWISTTAPFLVSVEYPQEPLYEDIGQLRAYAVTIINTLKELMPLNPMYSEELKFFLNRFVPNDPSPLTDFAASLTSASKDELQAIMEAVDLRQRMEKVIVLINKEMELVKLQAKIRQDVDEKMTQHQRQFFLREQLKIIQKELGISKDDRTADRDRFEERLSKLTLTDEAKSKVDDDLHKLSILETGSPEYALTRNYLDIITQLPWGVFTDDNLDLKRARKILDEEHEKLEDIKDRILEFIAVGQLRGKISGSIILLVGPPGVGKTSIGRSVAHALNRKFYRFSVGGMRDEAEIKGHRRTYVGAMPGKLIQALKQCQSANPVIMLDEIDKLSHSQHGDPASALLEVLDPEQNVDFLDHYLDVRFDLSNVLFICTANQLDTIPRPLLDRMEVMRLSGYITDEKVDIARKHLWPRLLERNGLQKNQITVTDAVIRGVIEGYAREAGVRNLEKRLGRIARKVAVKIVEKKSKKISIGKNDLENYLGMPVFQKEKIMQGVGIITGLAWTAMGGATLSIEATMVHSKTRGCKLTGKLGDVMRESAEIAYSYITSHVQNYGGSPTFFENAFIHIHVPEGATPKDGPSAGITMASALLSLARNQRVIKRIAMTGELTLTGYVFAVGGIREKVVAARRSGIKELIMPKACQGEYKELPAYIRAGMKIHFVEHYDEVAAILFK
jgi:ATP-dependent Lon protease